MQRLLIAVGHLARKDDGQDLIEYGMLVVLISVFAIGAVQLLGSTVKSVLWQVISVSSV
jgi:Flp pilus assembly pilin Flp